MKKISLTPHDIRELHRTGQLDAAKTGYLNYLQSHANDIETWDALSILCAQQDNMAEAIGYLQKALAIAPTHPILNLHLANMYKMEKAYAKASHILKNLVKLYPDYTPALNNLGTVYYAEGKWDDAIQTYRETIQKQPDYIDAYYNLGLALTKQNQWNEAIQNYQTLLELIPDHFAARFQLGCVLMYNNQIEEALTVFLEIEANHPNHFETQTNLATCYLKQGALNAAKNHYFKALELTPDDAQIFFNLGVINMQQGQTDVAIQHYQRALQLSPDNFSIHNNLGVAFLTTQHLSLATYHLQEALHLQPDNISIQHTLDFISERKHLVASPPEYIKSLFDSYADHYEQHLLQALQYQLPHAFLNMVLAITTPLSHAWNILDLGCGTGLCGDIFKPYAKRLVGIDLSSKMLDMAAEKKSYDELILGDITTYLTNKMACYHLILAGDTLVYMGDLKPIFKAISTALVEEGLCVFNTEIDEEKDFNINPSGRFTHHKKYIEKLASDSQLDIVSYEKTITRMQNNEAVYGHLFVLKRPKFNA